MKILDAGRARTIDTFDSHGASVQGLLHSEATSVAIIVLEEGSVLGEHPATVDQVFIVVEGSAECCGADGQWQSVREGQAALWTAGEVHTSRSVTGGRAVVVEAAGLLG